MSRGLGFKKFKKLLRSQKGQSTTEYILILAIVVMIALKFKGQFEGKMNTMIEDLTSKISEGINTN